jgi:hypothetical protein
MVGQANLPKRGQKLDETAIKLSTISQHMKDGMFVGKNVTK